MKNLFLLAVALIGLLTVSTESVAQTKKSKILAGYFLAFGRGATDGELNYWMGQPEKSVADYVNTNKTWLQGQTGEATAVIQRAYADVLGRQPTGGEINNWIGYKLTYADLFSRNLTWMNSNPSGKQDAIKAAYRTVFGRDAQPGELTYWQSQTTMPYTKLVAAHQTWKNANSPGVCRGGSSVACGTSLGPINTALVVPAMVGQFNAVPGASVVMDRSGFSLVASGGGNLVASGGGNLVASGGGNISVANLVASGGGN